MKIDSRNATEMRPTLRTSRETVTDFGASAVLIFLISPLLIKNAYAEMALAAWIILGVLLAARRARKNPAVERRFEPVAHGERACSGAALAGIRPVA